VKYLSARDILVMHALVIDKTGGSHGVRDVGLLVSAAERPKAMFGRKYLYKTVFEKAAALLESIAMNHAFVDGNKRTALISTARFLDMNGYTFTATNKHAATFVLKIVRRRPDIETIANWLEAHTK